MPIPQPSFKSRSPTLLLPSCIHNQSPPTLSAASLSQRDRIRKQFEANAGLTDLGVVDKVITDGKAVFREGRGDGWAWGAK